MLTAAHVDWPQQSRIVELVDNRDGTISIFGTLVDHAGPASPGTPAPGAVLDLASWSRELAFNDPQAKAKALGEDADRNVELMLRAPFPLRAAATPPAAGRGGTLPATGGDDRTRAAVAAVAVAGAAAAAAGARASAPETT